MLLLFQYLWQYHILPTYIIIMELKALKLKNYMTGCAQNYPRQFRDQLQKHLSRNLGSIVEYIHRQTLGGS